MMPGALARAEPRRAKPAARECDVDLHGVLRIRLIDFGSDDIEAVVRQLGAQPKPSSGAPDLVVEFVDDLGCTSLRRLEEPASSFGNDGLLRLRRGSKHAAIDFHSIGRQCRIVCETGIGEVPLLESIADVSILSKGFAVMHASALVHRGRRIIVTGWTHGGKTTALLAFAGRGATFVSDDRVWIRRDGAIAFGFSGEIRLREPHLEEGSAARSLTSTARRAALASLRGIESAWSRAGLSGEALSASSRVVGKTLAGLQRHLCPRVRPEQLFDRVEPTMPGLAHTVFVMMRHDERTIRVEPISSRELAGYAWATAQRTLARLAEHYLAYRFAFPELRGRWFERASRLHEETLATALQDTQAYRVYHPEGADLTTLYRTLEPLS